MFADGRHRALVHYVQQCKTMRNVCATGVGRVVHDVQNTQQQHLMRVRRAVALHVAGGVRKAVASAATAIWRLNGC